MNKILMFAALAEAGMGVILLAYPPIVVRLLFAAEIVGAGVIMSRLAGIALIGLGVACWPGHNADNSTSCALRAMLSYSLLATLYLGYLGITGEWVGKLLWPAIVVHAVVTILFARAWLTEWQALGPN